MFESVGIFFQEFPAGGSGGEGEGGDPSTPSTVADIWCLPFGLDGRYENHTLSCGRRWCVGKRRRLYICLYSIKL